MMIETSDRVSLYIIYIHELVNFTLHVHVRFSAGRVFDLFQQRTPSGHNNIYSFVTMTKLFTVLLASSCLAVSAFGPTASKTRTSSSPALVSGLRKTGTADSSVLFRDASVTRGGAVPGWAAYNDALDKSPLPTKALTSLFGWALGDLLAQASNAFFALIIL
jgi:hypothetical protein